MNENSVISIIIPVYNKEYSLNDCLNSLVNQSSKNMEIILVDMNSLDNSLKIIEEFTNNYSFIKYVNQDAYDVSLARNKGISMSNGEYIYFANARDYFEVNFIEKLDSILTKEKNDIILINIALIINKERYFQKFIFENETELTSNCIDKSNILFSQPFYTYNKVYKKKFLLENNLKFKPDPLDYEVIFHFNSLSKTSNIYFLDEKIYNHYINNENEIQDKIISNIINKTPENIMNIFNLIDEVEQILNDNHKYFENKENFIEFKITQLVSYLEFFYFYNNSEYAKLFYQKLKDNITTINYDIKLKKNILEYLEIIMKSDKISDYRNNFSELYTKNYPILKENNKNIANILKNKNKKLNEERKQIQANNNQLRLKNRKTSNIINRLKNNKIYKIFYK